MKVNGYEIKSYSDLYGAALSGTDLRGADLRGANLRGAALIVADLRGADLRGAKGITTFSFERNVAIRYLDRIQIGCQDHSISFWLENYVKIGKSENYTDKQIEAYGMFIKNMSELNLGE